METIHKGRYTADFGHDADGPLLVITKPKGGGVCLQGDTAEDWAHHIRTSIDKSEANALCRALLNT